MYGSRSSRRLLYLAVMAILKVGEAKDGGPMHFSVGALIRRDDSYLLIDRATLPFGFAGIAGHIDESESPEQALSREVREEAGLNVQNIKLLFEEELDWNQCNKGIGTHHWYLFECGTES